MVIKADRMELDKKAREIVKQMTLREKIALMGGHRRMIDMALDFLRGGYNYIPYHAGGCERLGVPMMKFVDGPRGVVSGHSTCFPVTMARGASFDPDLEERVGDVIGKEVRGVGGRYFGGVCVNVPYNPGWGRSQEVYTEDSYYMGEMGAALVRGVQRHNVIACVKHYAFNSMENSRYKVNITADKRTEREVFLPHFKRCIDEGAASVMGAYNLYQGDQCCHSDYLLNKVLRDEWGFDGFTISDFSFGVRDTVKGIKGGCDIEMCNTRYYRVRRVLKAIKKGLLNEDDITGAAVKIVRTLLAFEQAPDPQNYDVSLCASKEHTALARVTAEKSITLLKNENKVLPFDAATCKKVCVIGDLAQARNTGDLGSSSVKPPYVVTLMEGLKNNYPNTDFEFIPTKTAATQTEKLKSAHAVILICGFNYKDEGEYVLPLMKIGGDRTSLDLHKNDIEMIKAAGSVNPNTALILIGSNVILMSEWFDRVPAVIMGYYPGMEGGNALADILFGKVNPSGKLPYAVPVSAADLPQVDWAAKEQHYGYYHGYQKLDKDGKDPLFPFGFGLSYTSFALGDIRLESVDSQTAVFKATVKNTGPREGAEVVQLYIGFNNSAVDRPVKRFSAFQKVYLAAGAEMGVTLKVTKEALAYFNEEEGGFVQEDITYTAFIGNNEKDFAAQIDFSFCS